MIEFIPAEYVKRTPYNDDNGAFITFIGEKKYVANQIKITDAEIVSHSHFGGDGEKVVREILENNGFDLNCPIESERLERESAHIFVQLTPCDGIEHIKVEFSVPALVEEHKKPPFDTIEELREWMKNGCQV